MQEKVQVSNQSSFLGPEFYLECTRLHNVHMSKGAKYCLLPDLCSWVKNQAIFSTTHFPKIIILANKGIYQEVRYYFLKRNDIFFPNLLYMGTGIN